MDSVCARLALLLCCCASLASFATQASDAGLAAGGYSSSTGDLSSAELNGTTSDTTPPIITLYGDNPQYVEQYIEYSGGPEAVYMDPGYSALDNVDGDVTGAVQVTGFVDIDTPGVYTLTYTVTDSSGNTATVVRVVFVQEALPPVITNISASPSEIWPPDHKMIPVTISATAVDTWDAAPVCKIISVAANEAVSAPGTGNTSPDWQITGNLTLDVRAERCGSGTGRVYTVTVQCTNFSGKSTTGNVTVSVPLDQSKPVNGAGGMSSDHEF